MQSRFTFGDTFLFLFSGGGIYQRQTDCTLQSKIVLHLLRTISPFNFSKCTPIYMSKKNQYTFFFILGPLVIKKINTKIWLSCR